MADSETAVPAEEQTPNGGEVVPEETQQEVVSGESNDQQGEVTQQAEEADQDANVDNTVQQENDSGEAAVDGEDATETGGEAAASEEQAAVEEPATTEAAETEVQQESQQQEAEPEISAEQEAEPKMEEQQETEQEASKADETQEVEISEEEKAKCRKHFDRKARDGRLDIKGFKTLFRLMGQVLSAEAADAMFKEVNSTENGGTIDFDDFCVLYAKFWKGEQARKEDLMNSIDKLFPSSDGEPVRLKKVEGILMRLQQPDLDMRLVREKSDLNPSDIRSLVKSMDKNGQGYISKEEFVETLTRHLDLM